MTVPTQSHISQVVVLCWNAPSPSDRNANKIAAFLGSEVTFVPLTRESTAGTASLQTLIRKCVCLITSVETLANAADIMPTGVAGIRTLDSVAKHVFVYGFQPTGRHNAILQALSADGLAEVRPLPDSGARFHVAENHRRWSGQFSGLTLGAADPSIETSFVEGTGRREQTVIIRAGGRPFFVHTTQDGALLFFLACRELADLDEKVKRGSRPLLWFSRLLPLMMFLRGALGERLWHNDHPRACFIIDDPLLKKRYGFVEYRRLLEVMARHRFSACIAFIPWNYRRSSRAVASLVSSTYRLPFLCVHGCDHTDAEFAVTNFDELHGKARLALHRMKAHTQLYGVSFDDVMVFPQGRFSTEAVLATKASGYLASVNGAVCPSTMPESLTLRDLLDVAVTRFGDFPLFGRRYPRDPADFALDLFLGKPALAVEHHDYFQNGYEALETFVERLNSLEERLEWSNLATICSQACLTRTVEGGEVYVRFYTSRFSIKNTGRQTQRYMLFTRQTPSHSLPSVTINGRPWACEREDGDLKICLSLDTGQVVEVRVLPTHSDEVSFWSPTDVHNARVTVRRLLCEFRDNYVDTTGVLRRMVSATRNLRSRGKLQTVRKGQ